MQSVHTSVYICVVRLLGILTILTSFVSFPSSLPIWLHRRGYIYQTTPDCSKKPVLLLLFELIVAPLIILSVMLANFYVQWVVLHFFPRAKYYCRCQ
jgi:hypothetical protein